MIEGVAVKFKFMRATIEVRLPKPARHTDCIEYADEVLKLPVWTAEESENHGFYDSDGNYLDRKRAMSQVRMTGQELRPRPCGNINRSERLYCEDLW